tara:strand:- start:244 stop:459 length:216 start_codon:yes stop_codon:yes gene_type:complete
MKTPEELSIDYENNKKKKTIRTWKKTYNINIDLEHFNHFKENKKYYILLRDLEEIKKNLDPYILNQFINEK